MDELEWRAFAAARAVAADHGVAVDEATILHSGSNVLVHLRPAPVVVRVMSGTVVLHASPQRWLARERSVLEFLAPSGLAVTPTRLFDAGPVCHGGLWMTFVEWLGDAEPTPASVDPRRLGRVLRGLHDTLAPFDGELDGPPEVRQRIERLFDLVTPGETIGTAAIPAAAIPAAATPAAAITALRARFDALAGRVFTAELVTQPVHGDVSFSNLLRVGDRLVWNDFEDTFRGPVHWDVANLVSDLRSRGASPLAVRTMLDAYGFGDEAQLAPFIAAQDVYDELWAIYDRLRRTGRPLP